MAAAGPGLSDYFEAIARSFKGELPDGYGYSADIELGVGFIRDQRTGCSVLERPLVIPSGDANLQGYITLYAYCSKDGVESMLNGQVPPMLPATRKEPKHFTSLAAIADNFGAKDPKKVQNSKFCVPLRVPAEITSQVDTPGRDIWLVRFNLDKITPFLVAAREGDADKVAKICEAGVSGGVMDENGVTALMMAAMAGSTDTCRVLLDNGAAIDAAEPVNSRTAAMFAAQGGKKAVLDAKNVQGMTACAIAEKMGHSETSRALCA